MRAPFSTTVDFQLDRVRLFSRAPTKIFLGHISSACVLIYLAWDVLAIQWILLWAILEIAITPMLLYILSKQAEDADKRIADLDQWQMQLHALFALVGISWGTFVSLGLDVQNSVHFSIQMAIVAGASAAAARSLGIFKFSFFFYVIPFTGLLSIRIFLMGGEFILLGALVLIFAFMMCGLANDTSEELSEYLATKLDNLDLAERYRAAATEAERANSAKTRFLAQANHDLRQPIHAIGLLTECLRAEALDDNAEEILDTIDTSVENLSKLFKSLLSVTTLDSGNLKLEMSSFSLDEVIRQTVRQAQPEADQRGCQLRIVHTSSWVRTDKILLSSILQNLVFNAVKYAPNAKILVGARRVGDTVSVHVIDQGQGVPEHLVSKIFDEFVRGNPHGPGRIDGLGLGLSIVSRTAHLLGLDVGFRSQQAIGTHVNVSGLVKAAVKSHVSQSPRSSTHTIPVKTRVLVVDDNREVLIGMETLLRKWGYDATTRLPEEELEFVPDILLMDFHLNGLKNGIELATEIGGTVDGFLPTAIISGTISDDIERQAREAGYWTMHKPVAALRLRSVLLAMAAYQANAEQ